MTNLIGIYSPFQHPTAWRVAAGANSETQCRWMVVANKRLIQQNRLYKHQTCDIADSNDPRVITWSRTVTNGGPLTQTHRPV